MNVPAESTMRRTAANLLSFLLAAAEPCEPLVVADEDLEYWGRFYIENNFAARGILFETFMSDSFAIAQAVIFSKALPLPQGEDFYPLLPRQREVAMRLHPHVHAISKPVPPVGREFHEGLFIPHFMSKLVN